MSRRSFLLLALSVALAGPVLFVRWRTTVLELYVRSVIEENLAFLKIPRTVLAMFVKDYEARNGYGRVFRLYIIAVGIAVVGRRVTLSLLPAPFRGKLDLFERDLCSALLMSTNYFDPSKECQADISYSMLYDPFVNPCFNVLTGNDALANCR